MEHDESVRLGADIRRARIEAGISQSDLSEETGLSVDLLNRMESGLDSGIDSYLTVAHALDLRVALVESPPRGEGQCTTVLDSLFSYVAILDLDGRVVGVNNAPLERGGYRREDVVGNYFYDAPWWSYDNDVRSQLIQAIRAAARGQKSRYTVSVKMGDELTPIDFQIAPVYDEYGNVAGLIPTAVDVSDRIKAEEEKAAETARLLAAMQHAEAANRAKSKFLATMSHELRTPLNSILGFSDLLRGDPTLSANQREDLDVINRSGTHLLGLINQALDMAKIESGQVLLETSTVNLPALINDVDLMMRGRMDAKGLPFTVEVAGDLPEHILGDGQKLRQIMLNLIGNSLKFTANGSVTVRVKTTADPGLVIDVEDTGLGIPEDQKGRIFEPFVQLQEAGAPGTGLGLSIAREYARLMGGDLELSSEVGLGSRFRVTIPLKLAPSGQHIESEESRCVIGLAPGQPQWRVLVVEDDPVNRLLLGRLLDGAGFAVAFAEDGGQAQTVFDEFRPHFIWMDRRMAVMDGIEATSRIRARDGGKDVKIAALTATVLDEQRTEWDRAGVDDFVRKPFQANEIFDCMARLLGAEYRYGGHDLPPQEDAAPDLQAELGNLPEPLRAQLTQALIIGSSKLLTAALSQIREISPGTGDALQPYIQEYNYSPVLDALAPPP